MRGSWLKLKEMVLKLRKEKETKEKERFFLYGFLF